MNTLYEVNLFMNRIQLHTDMPRNITMIPNAFLDHYMARANGEFLKIYLYLLRWAGCPDADITTASIADFFNMTENDIKRALRFWEQEDLLHIAWDANGNISAICLRPVTAPYEKHAANAAADTNASSAISKSEEKPSSNAFISAKSNAVSEQNTTNGSASAATAAQAPSYPMEDLEDFIEHHHGDELFFVIQQYTGKPLSSTDMNTILFFYRELGMSIDLIEYLFEYCISNGHKRMNYIQKVAINWANIGITTIADAKSYCAGFNQLNTAVINAFGIKNRYLSDDELDYVHKWNKEMQFSQELILEACRRTIMTAHSASFKYAHSILERWKSNNVQSLEDVRRLDEAFEKNKAERTAKQQENSTSSKTNTKKPASRFHNFNQRSYDYGKMEMEFVKKLQERKQQ